MLLLENSSQATKKKKKKKKKNKNNMLMMMMKLKSSLHCHDSVVFAGEACSGFMGIHSTHVVRKSIAKLKQQTICLWMSPSSIFESAQKMVLPSASLRGYRNCDASSSSLKQEEQGEQGEQEEFKRRRRRKGNGEGRKERTNT